MSLRFLLAAASVAALVSASAQAALTVSSKATRNVTCTAGVCAATARNAVLNGDDLAAMLQSGDVTVASGRIARDIVFSQPPKFEWTGGHRLGLDAYRSLTIAREMLCSCNSGGLDLKTNDGGNGGTLDFADRGYVAFINPVGVTLTINGANYALENSVHALANAVAGNPSGDFALAGPVNAGTEGTFETAAVPTALNGRFEGLGNTIQHLRINAQAPGANVGLFAVVGEGAVSHVRLSGSSVLGGNGARVGGLAGICMGPIDHVGIVSGRVQGKLGASAGGVCGMLDGTLSEARSSASVTGVGDSTADGQGVAGGLVGAATGGTVIRSAASGEVLGGANWIAGGLVGHNNAAVQTSFATGAVLVGDGGTSGGLIGTNINTVANAYATGTTQGGVGSSVGGMLGTNSAAVSTSYSSGPVASGSGNAVGGFVGDDTGTLGDDYFDIDTSGQSHGAGNNTADPGITGLTNAQFQSGLPAGYDPAVWGQDPAVNNGLPYLLAVTP
jgi:hypothetical protein